VTGGYPNGRVFRTSDLVMAPGRQRLKSIVSTGRRRWPSAMTFSEDIWHDSASGRASQASLELDLWGVSKICVAKT
jgi:hypothetical protein